MVTILFHANGSVLAAFSSHSLSPSSSLNQGNKEAGEALEKVRFVLHFNFTVSSILKLYLFWSPPLTLTVVSWPPAPHIAHDLHSPFVEAINKQATKKVNSFAFFFYSISRYQNFVFIWLHYSLCCRPSHSL